MISLDDYLEQNHDTLTGPADSSPEQEFDVKETKETLIREINKLTETERQIVRLYYYSELSGKQISEIMGLSRSRISQIRLKAIARLKAGINSQTAEP